MKKNLIFVCVVFLSFATLFAQEGETGVSLSSSDVKQFIDEFPGLRKDFEQLDIKYNSGSTDWNIPEGMEAMEKVNGVLKKHGYTDYNDFILKFSAIISSYVSITTDVEMKKAQPDMEKAIAEIENNEYYSEEQKEQMKAVLIQTSNAIKGMSAMASQENIAVVKPFVGDITRILEVE